MKRIVGWAVVNDHGKIPILYNQKQLLIFKTKEAAYLWKSKKDSVVKVTIERQALDV